MFFTSRFHEKTKDFYAKEKERIFDLTVELSFGLLVKSQTVVVACIQQELSRAWPTSYQQLTLWEFKCWRENSNLM